MRIILCSVLAVLVVPQLATARILYTWTYREMFDKADLVIIAQYISSKETGERIKLKDIDLPIDGIGMVSEFEGRLVLKGSKDTTKFTLHHYRVEHQERYANGPRVIQIAANTHPTFLLFLIKEKDGKYAPVTGQTDPAIFSVLELMGGAR